MPARGPGVGRLWAGTRVEYVADGEGLSGGREGGGASRKGWQGRASVGKYGGKK